MFSFDSYLKIIDLIQRSGKAADFYEAQTRDEFVIMRHDVEFSVDRAYALYRLEKSRGFTSTFFFQWTNNSYNILSRKNTEIIRRMHEGGHRIGLHFALNGLTDTEEIREKILLEIKALTEMMGFPIDSFSFHRPPAYILRENLKLPGIINAYEDRFFSFADQVTADTPLEVKYISDAMHRWNYGYPDEAAIMNHKKVQILTHPYSWTEEGYDNLNNFRSLISELNGELIRTIDGECRHFAKVREELM